MSERRLWTVNEIDLLLDLVTDCYQFLSAPLNNSKTKTMIDKKWSEITTKINALGEGQPLAMDKVKKKWFDLKSTSKKAVMLYNKEAG